MVNRQIKVQKPDVGKYKKQLSLQQELVLSNNKVSPCIICFQYIGECSVHWRDIKCLFGDIMIHLGELIKKSL